MKKILIIVAVVVALALIVGFTVRASSRNAVTVQTGKVVREDLASMVSASGQIKPKTYVNIGANAFGKIVKLYVQEGEHVKRGQILAQLENVQSSADMQAQQATLESSKTDAEAMSAAETSAAADVSRAKADLEQKEIDYRRSEDLYKAQLVAKADFDSKKAAYNVAVAMLAQSQANLAKAKADRNSASGHINTAQATLRRFSDQLSKTTYVAPFDGVITNLPVREGETVVVGIQNSPGSTLMTIADMSVITAEVQVDETDIVNVQRGQSADVTIDAIPGKSFKAKVTEIGDNAIIRSSGLSTAQSTTGSQEAKDFKVVVTLDNPPENLRPGLSTTAKIITATKQSAVSIPIQALTIRQKGELQAQALKPASSAGASSSPAKNKDAKEELQGVFVVKGVGGARKAEFVAVQTGVTGSTDIEITSGLSEGDEIVTGSYKILRTLRNGAGVKVDNSVAKKEEEKS